MAGIDSYTKILVRGGGANGTYAFVDSSDNARTLTTTGTYNYYSTAHTKFQTSSIALTLYGNSRFTAASHSDLELGSGDWVIDYWIKHINTSNNIGIAEKYYWRVSQDASGKPRMTPDNGTTYWVATNAITQNVWTHVAWVRNGNTVTCYCDGTANGSWSYSSTPSTSGIQLSFGTQSTISSSIHVCFDEFRFSKGTNRGWTSNFTPPTAAYTGTSYNHTADGGAVTGGTATVTTPQVTNNADGGAVGGGSAGFNYNVLRHVADGGAVVGGAADTEIPLGFQWDGGVVAGGSADVSFFAQTGPTQHWTFNNIASGIVQNEVEGGATVYAVGRATTTDKWGGTALDAGVIESNPLSISENVSFQSISLWVKRQPNGYDGTVAAYPTGTDGAIDINFGGDRVWVKGSGSWVECAEPLDSGSDWQHVVVVIPITGDTSKVYVYVNGVRDPNLLDVGIFGTIRYLSYWNWSYTLNKFPAISNVQLYNRPLTQEEVTYLYEADSALRTAPRIPNPEYIYVHVASGGAVAGGQATLNHGIFDCTLPYPEVDMQADVTNVARMDCTIPYPTVSIDTAGYMECVLQQPIVDITTQHTVLADLECILPMPTVGIEAVNTLLYTMDCTLPYPTVEMLTRGSYYSMDCALLQPIVDILADAGAVFYGELGFPERDSATYSSIPASTEEILCFSRQ
jgi:hypothetical protein